MVDMKAVKLVSGVLGSAALVSGGVSAALAVPAVAQESPQVVQIVTNEQGTAPVAGPVQVQGTFAYDQGVVSSNKTISGVFAKAAAALCATMPQYGASAAASELRISVGGESFNASIADLAESEGGQATTMGCTCTGNGPGGGAIANADVSGAGIASIIRMLSI